ncbi:GNAT family N-acetyltransferase [Skermanella sp. TT6]|uniref:GNAT family N-acetyltransferase n=1 Tax=Skermanella cutis TaxID=2775420 RepID=A0ABX7BCD8_9PROT|nr:GNAT family N-acetyltransferase [Skermanella sp. TT6]QQP91804.1 GNAT family N-acetyltransferase [Skermanella sp. TT6]
MIGRIRRARLDDAAAIAYVHVAGWRETYPGIVPDRTLAAMDVFSRTRYWAQVLDNKRNRIDVFVAEMPVEGEDRVVGFGVTGPEQVGLADYSGEFHALYVLQVGQGRGLGTRLMTTMAANLVLRGMTASTVWALRDNLRARRFYEKMGGVLVSERPLMFDGTRVMEVAYGWSDVTPLARRSEEAWR